MATFRSLGGGISPYYEYQIGDTFEIDPHSYAFYPVNRGGSAYLYASITTDKPISKSVTSFTVNYTDGTSTFVIRSSGSSVIEEGVLSNYSFSSYAITYPNQIIIRISKLSGTYNIPADTSGMLTTTGKFTITFT